MKELKIIEEWTSRREWIDDNTSVALTYGEVSHLLTLQAQLTREETIRECHKFLKEYQENHTITRRLVDDFECEFEFNQTN